MRIVQRNQGAGETTMVEFRDRQLKATSLVLIDELETSLHPRVQRLIIRKLAEICRLQDIQIILTTHSPTILEELPLEARVYIIKQQDGSRQVVTGVSPEFAMTKMDEERHPECDVYVEDMRAETLVMKYWWNTNLHYGNGVSACRMVALRWVMLLDKWWLATDFRVLRASLLMVIKKPRTVASFYQEGMGRNASFFMPWTMWNGPNCTRGLTADIQTSPTLVSRR
jgi:hypothetical protein